MRLCDIDGCTNVHRARGLCSTHYNNITNHLTSPRRDGNPERKRRDDLARAKRRRALTRGADAELIDRWAVGERDGWRCGICLKPVNPALKWPHLMSQSLDHVVPLIEGGHHVTANVRITHVHCNASRGARGGGEQLALI